MSYRLALWACLSALLAAPASAGTSRIGAGKIIEALIRDLGAERHDARERATELLRRVGQPALDALEKAAESDDPEVRLRARDLLADVRLGIGPDWPADIVLLIRHYDNLQEHERSSAIYRIASMGPRAVPFLVKRIEAGSRNEASWALNALQRQSSDEACQEIIRLIPEPKTDQLARALAWARSQRGQALEGIEALAAKQAVELARDKAAEEAIEKILAGLEAGKPKDALAAAEALAAKHPDEPRALYLQAEALIPLNRDKEAIALRDKALGLNPDKEPPHYLAAELLARLGRYRLAAREWLKVTEIEPSGGPADANAWLNLAALHTANGLFEPAAQFLEKAIQIILKAQDQEKARPVATALQSEVNRLRQRAASFPVSAEAALEDPIPPSELQVKLQAVPAEGKPEDLEQALAATAAQFQLAAELPAVPVLDLPSAGVKFDKAAKAILVTLHGEPACDPLPFVPQGNEPRIAIHVPGSTHIYKLDPATGTAERLARFDKSYVLTLVPGLRVSALANPSLRINGRPVEWGKALGGIPLPHLPESFDIIVEGSAPLGKRMTVRASIPAREPQPPPAKP